MTNLNATFNLKGKSGSQYVFYVHTMDNERLDESGIYIFTKRDFNAINRKHEHKIIYIEKSESFQRHNRDQHIKDCIDELGGNCICLKQIENAKDRERIEDDLLDNYDTVCNEEPILIE
jgi:hypothetical protein